MAILAIERSTATQSVALAGTGRKTVSRTFAGIDSRSGEWAVKVRDFLEANGTPPAELDAIAVGLGPGSFAGIRAALAFAHGMALGASANGRRIRVCGLPSTLALVRDRAKTAVIGDARRERYWVALYDGFRPVRDFFLVRKEELGQAAPEGFSVVTPDGQRIGDLLSSLYGRNYAGALTPVAEHLAEAALAAPDMLRDEPLPVYLQGAVKE